MNSTEDRAELGKVEFSKTFLSAFNSMMEAYDRELSKLKTFVNGTVEYGVCNCSYKLRYITPSDVATYIGNLDTLVSRGILGYQNRYAQDHDLFAVESVKRFLRQNGCVPLEQTSLSGDPIGNIPKGATLKDVVFAVMNEVFNVCVYSGYELKKRYESMACDLKRIQDMHFSASMRSIVNRLPAILRESDQGRKKHTITCIESFIMFASMLNLITIIQMQGYSIPRDGYKITDVEKNDVNVRDDVQQESVNLTAAHPIFFVFTEGKTPFMSKAISKATKSQYTHVSISFDPSLEHMYAFGGGGVRRESIKDNVREKLDISVFGTYVTKDHADQMKEASEDFIKNASKTKFAYSALIKKLFGSDKRDNNGYRQICTTFVNGLLSEIGHPLVDKNIPSPKEMRDASVNNPDKLFELYKGASKEYNSKRAADLLRANAKKEKSKAYDEVVTECCMLKTNDYYIANKLPFNCNMKSVVLQDMTNGFEDTMAALEFIMNDARSPIHQLVIQYFDPDHKCYADIASISRILVGCDHANYRGTVDPFTSLDGSTNNGNWLDMITYGNMYHDGNYRRDAVGNNHVDPIMNTLEMIYKMFGGCDNECDNSKLANHLIDVGRLMKSIITNSCVVQDRDVKRDVLAVLGEIFTRYMLRLYYNNNHAIQSTDQMLSTMAPAYMYSESYILESNGFTSNNDTSKVKAAGVGAKNVIEAFINWVRNKLAKFLPEKFNDSYKAQIEWFNKNGKAKYDEIIKAYNEKKYKFPTKDKLQEFNVSFAPEKVKPHDVMNKYMTGTEEIDATKVKTELLDMFINKPELTAELAKKSGDDLKKALTNAILYSQLEEKPPIENEPLDEKKFTSIYNDLKTLCDTKGDKHYIQQFDKLCKDLGNTLDGLKDLVEKGKPKTESYIILNKDSVFTEMDGNENKTPTTTSTPAAKANSGGESAPELKNEGDGEQKSADGKKPTTTSTDDAESKKAQRAQKLYEIFKDVSSSCYTTAANVVCRNLFATLYSDFKGVLDDYATMKNSGSDSTAQQNSNDANANTNANAATNGNGAPTTDASGGQPAQL